jgi:hypothetical protein
MIAVVVAVGVTTSGGRALAGVIIAISEVGDNVVVDASGSVNLSALTRLGDGAAFADVEGGLGQVAVGSSTPGDFTFGGSPPALRPLGLGVLLPHPVAAETPSASRGAAVLLSRYSCYRPPTCPGRASRLPIHIPIHRSLHSA